MIYESRGGGRQYPRGLIDSGAFFRWPSTGSPVTTATLRRIYHRLQYAVQDAPLGTGIWVWQSAGTPGTGATSRTIYHRAVYAVENAPDGTGIWIWQSAGSATVTGPYIPIFRRRRR